MRSIWFLCLTVVLFAVVVSAGVPDLDRLGEKDRKGRYIVPKPQVDEKFRNPGWCDEWEDGFRDRADSIIRTTLAMGPVRGNTYFENEKRTYGQLMLQALGGEVEHAMSVLQGRDHQADIWHKETAGIDYYACFTIKHQMRKYFYFGGLMKPDYKRQMYDGAWLWTRQDPLRRAHYAYERSKSGWGPDVKNSWVDVRSTDNLYLMRVTSVYLMAEETGNEKTRQIYKVRFATFVKSLYRIGQGEWDSENYHGHSIAPVHSLYDFAKDQQVKLLAKACLDWFYAAGAVKYRRGGFNGPTKRDYNHVAPFGGSAAGMLWVMFGDAPRANTHLESDEVHIISSAYRAPEAVVHLAKKNLDGPVEIFAAKPGYTATQQGDYELGPQYLETQYLSRTFQLGTLARGTQERDVNGFKIMMDNSKTGVDDIQCICGPDPLYPGSPKYQPGKLAGRNRVAQYRNMAIWLVEDGKSDWVWVMPKAVAVEQQNGITFLEGEQTWIAIHPVNLSIKGVDGALTEKIAFKIKGDKKEPHWTNHQVVSAKGKGGTLCGFAIEIGESGDYENFAAFKKAICSNAVLDDSGIESQVVQYKGTCGDTIKMRFADELGDYKVWRNGKLHDWSEHRVGYRQADKANGVIEQDWLGGTLTVRAGGKEFSCTVDDEGRVTFYNK